MGQEDEEEDVNSYRMILRKGKDIENWKVKNYIALCLEHALEAAMYCTSRDNCIIIIINIIIIIIKFFIGTELKMAIFKMVSIKGYTFTGHRRKSV
jgi:hypothetical protein